ncbi:MAG TPA: ester cyclase [Mycobacterium sp.]|nr:ester cyclase [Mycobacterium sp.]
MSTQHNRSVVERFDNLLGASALDELDQLCTPDLINHALAPSRPQGLAGTREFLTETANRFGGDGWSELRVIADGDFVVQHGIRGGHWQGGPLFGFDPHPGPYGREVAFVYRLEAGRIAERWAVRDDLTMLRQLRALDPAP